MLLTCVYDTNNTFEKLIDNQIQTNLPLLSGFFAIYLQNVRRPLSKIPLIPLINQDSSSCLQFTKICVIDSLSKRSNSSSR